MTGDSSEAADDNVRHAARRTLPEEMPEQKRRDAPGALASEVDATDPECFFPRLTPELSRAAKRRRLGRVVRRDVKAEADLLQARATTVMRGSLAASREHHRGQ